MCACWIADRFSFCYAWLQLSLAPEYFFFTLCHSCLNVWSGCRLLLLSDVPLCFQVSFSILHLLVLVHWMNTDCICFLLLSSSCQLFYTFGFRWFPLFTSPCLYKEVAWLLPLSVFGAQPNKGVVDDIMISTLLSCSLIVIYISPHVRVVAFFFVQHSISVNYRAWWGCSRSPCC